MRLIKLSSTATLGLSLLLGACAAAPLPLPVSQAEAVSESNAAQDAKEYAPQAYAKAEKLRGEARWLHKEGRIDEASLAGEQAIAAYSEAFALSRVSKADERIEQAKSAHRTAKEQMAALDALQEQITADADAFEMRARVHLDTEEVKDVTKISPERAKARRLAARQLTAEASLLCLATRLIDAQAKDLDAANKKVERLTRELSHGSVKDDLYPRAAKARSQCLRRLSLARRPAAQKAPESAAADRLLKDLTETGKVFAYRDDRGVVVNLGSPLDKDGALTDTSQAALKLLGGTSRAHPNFPLLVVTHTAKKNQDKRAGELGIAAKKALIASGAPQVNVHSVSNAQPIINTRVRGADSKNERIEIVFVSPGR